jgi:hypothetical protein
VSLYPDNGPPVLVGRFLFSPLEAIAAMRENDYRLMRSFERIIRVSCIALSLASLVVSAELKKRVLPTGLWGGPHISLTVSKTGAKVEYDCAHGTIDRSIVLDQNGRFNVSGKQFSERGGPSRQDEPPGYPVTFSGEVKDKTLTLNVRNSSTKEDLGTFTLVYGAQSKLFKCK